MFRIEILPTNLSATTDVFIAMTKKGFLYQSIEQERYLKHYIKKMWDALHMNTRDDIAIIITNVLDKRAYFCWRDMHKNPITDKDFLKQLKDTQAIIINQE